MIPRLISFFNSKMVVNLFTQTFDKKERKRVRSSKALNLGSHFSNGMSTNGRSHEQRMSCGKNAIVSGDV